MGLNALTDQFAIRATRLYSAAAIGSMVASGASAAGAFNGGGHRFSELNFSVPAGDLGGGRMGGTNGGADPYQNSHGEQVYTMNEFIEANQGLTRNEIINQRLDRSKTPFGSQEGGPKMRYVISPHDGRIIDMRHMLIVGNGPVIVGNVLEVGQWIAGQKSGMDAQDFYSNGVGYQFYMQSSSFQRLIAPTTFTGQLKFFFSNPKVIYNW